MALGPRRALREVIDTQRPTCLRTELPIAAWRDGSIGDTCSMELELKGGVANAGAVTRVGQHVLRPSNAHTRTIHRLLRHLADEGFGGAPIPVGVEQDGRERLRFIVGDVALPPYPRWAQTDEALASIARLMSRFHRAAAHFCGVGERYVE